MSKNLTKIYYLLVLLLFIFIRVIGIKGDIVNTDAERWHRRSENFLEALKQHNYIETYQRYHPGVTLMWVNAFVKFISFKYQLTYTNSPLTLENADYFLIIDAISKIFNIFIYTILLGIQLFLIKKLFTSKISLLYGFLLSLEPYFIAINRWFHQTSFEVMFAFISFLSLLVWYKNKKVFYIFLSSLALALSVLAKVTSLILVPVLLIIFLLSLRDKNYVVNIKHGFLFLLVLILSIFLLFPALWVNPLFVWNQMYGSIFDAVTDNVRAQMITGINYYLYYFLITIFKLSPITLILFMVSIFYLRKTDDLNIKMLIISIFNYLVFLTITEQKIDRYFLVFIPFISLICAIYISKFSVKRLYVLLASIVIFTSFFIYKYFPVYSAYYSPLFGGTKNSLIVGIYDNSGEYFSQAGLYLNTLGRDKYTYVPNGFSSINLLYKGKIQREFDTNTNYIVTSLDMTRKYIDTIYNQACPNLLKSFGPKNDIPLVYVWECN